MFILCDMAMITRPFYIIFHYDVHTILLKIENICCELKLKPTHHKNINFFAPHILYPWVILMFL